MAYDLEVTFVGMCLFTHRDGAMHVLMPGTGGSTSAGGHDHGHGKGQGQGGHAVERHTTQLLFDVAYLLPGSTGETGDDAHVLLTNRELVLDGTGELDPTLPDDLAHVGAQIRPEVFGHERDEFLAAAVRLTQGRCAGHDPGAVWIYQEEARNMSHRIVWSIPRDGEGPLELRFQSLSGAYAGRVPPLHPIDGKVRLEVWHVPPHELPPGVPPAPTPARGALAHHFTAFDRLLEEPVDVPLFVKDPERDNRDGKKGGQSVTCMGGQG